ncbi:MAG: glycosyltransferase family 4 protein [Acidobacteria bacterium]|nr:glycosyltransferase family 4 protein [Acidobacteriota bacterium]
MIQFAPSLPLSPLPKVPEPGTLRALIVWPFPRLARILGGLSNCAGHEEMDGLSYLADHRVRPLALDSTLGWLNPFASKGSLLAGIDPFRFLKSLWHYSSFDVLISIDSSSCFLFVLLKRLLGLRKPVVVIDPALNPLYLNRMRLHRQVLPYVNHVVVFGKIQEEFVRKELGGRVRVSFVHHRIDCRFFDAAVCPSSNVAVPYVLSVGNDIGRDFERLIESVEALPVRLIIRTSRPLKRALPPNVQVQAGWIRFEDLRSLYAGATAVVLSLHNTLHAGGINTLLEAMSMGRAVVVSRSVGILDYVQHGVSAWVVEPESTVALREGIQRILEDEPLRQKLGNNARRFCETVCAMPVYAGRIAALLEEFQRGK